MSKPTLEQQEIIDHIKSSTSDELILVNSIAGAGKTHLLTEIVKQVPHTSGLYLAYNKSIAVEASKKFPSSIDCLTTHSLAYRNTVKQNGLRVGTFTYRDIQEKVHYETKAEVIDCIKQYCLSSYIEFQDYATSVALDPYVVKLCETYLEKMSLGKIECTHDFYLKLFHTYLADGHLVFNKLDFLLLDESGDLNEVTLEIFKLLPARIKVAVGDSNQNIYTFNHTINAFSILNSEGTHFNLTQSFRVSSKVASRIEAFCKRFIDPSMQFKGIDYTDNTIKDRCFITRTNAGLINQMIQLNMERTPYTLVRSASEIFRIPLMICYLKYQGKITEPSYKHLQADFDEWYEEPKIQLEYKNPLLYLQDIHEHDFPLQQAIKLVLSKGKKLVIDTFEEAKKHEKLRTNLYLSTSHSSKGLEWDEVVITEDMNKSIEDLITTMTTVPDYVLSPEDLESLNLYYVACSRAKKSLLNARFL